jgi:hypothetical protein
MQDRRQPFRPPFRPCVEARGAPSDARRCADNGRRLKWNVAAILWLGWPARHLGWNPAARKGRTHQPLSYGAASTASWARVVQGRASLQQRIVLVVNDGERAALAMRLEGKRLTYRPTN